MASPHATFTELVSTTMRNHSKDIADAISNSNVLYARMQSGGMKRRESGGLSIVTPLEYAENQTYQRFSGYDVLNVGASEVLTSAEFQWRQIALNVTASGQELRINAGQRILNLAKTRIKNAVKTFKNNFSYDMYSDGTLPNQINGLAALVSDSGTGTVGGIDSSVWSFWANVVQSAAAPLQGGGAVTMSATTIEKQMQILYQTLIRGNDRPNLAIADMNYFTMYEDSQLSLKRYTQAEKAKGGFMSLMYKDMEVVYDGDSGIPANRMYFLDTSTLELVVHEDADLNELPEAKPYNQDASVTPFIWMGNLTVSNRARNGIMKP